MNEVPHDSRVRSKDKSVGYVGLLQTNCNAQWAMSFAWRQVNGRQDKDRQDASKNGFLEAWSSIKGDDETDKVLKEFITVMQKKPGVDKSYALNQLKMFKLSVTHTSAKLKIPNIDKAFAVTVMEVFLSFVLSIWVACASLFA